MAALRRSAINSASSFFILRLNSYGVLFNTIIRNFYTDFAPTERNILLFFFYFSQQRCLILLPLILNRRISQPDLSGALFVRLGKALAQKSENPSTGSG
ncbi:hypothetical protein GSF70_00620 [Flavobacteriaceae bacterium W22]|nr:hypothetical protein [Flavobacteriaceae bacterium W22]